MKNKKIDEIISEYRYTGILDGKVEEKYINIAEEKLQVKFSESYKEFLREYGGGDILGIEINGVTPAGNPTVVLSTEEYRRLGLDINCVVVEDCGEFAMCLDTERMRDNECPIISWHMAYKIKNERYKNFEEYLLDSLNEAVDNWDDDFDEE